MKPDQTLSEVAAELGQRPAKDQPEDSCSSTCSPLPIGTRVRFLKTLDSGPDEFGPGNHYATKGDLGTVAEGQFPCHEGHWVFWDGWSKAPFGAKLGEDFEVYQENSADHPPSNTRQA